VDFAYSEDQLAFRDAVRDLLTDRCPPSAVRAAWDAPSPWDRGRWAALAEMGVPGLAVAEAHGGLGLAEVDLVLLLEEAGAAALPEPLVETALLAPLLPDEWQARIAGGEALVAAAPAGATHVAGAADADLVLVGTEGYAPPADAEAQPSVDGARRLVRTAEVTAGERVLTLQRDPFDHAALGTAATLVGLARHLVEVTVAYATERHQFGQPIGGFQAVKHHLADAHLAVEFAAPAVDRAAWSLATAQPTVARDVSMAKAMAGDAAERAARTALQVHGAIGYTFESDLHLWMKRVWALAPAWGDAAWHRARVAAAVIDG
jgi:alkylation response protein AidB-like acyl-CoA dehydrogenase